MERYFKNTCDITYQSELILDIFDVKDLIRAKQFTFNFRFRKLCAH